jgi:hypothetical protein
MVITGRKVVTFKSSLVLWKALNKAGEQQGNSLPLDE